MSRRRTLVSAGLAAVAAAAVLAPAGAAPSTPEPAQAVAVATQGVAPADSADRLLEQRLADGARASRGGERTPPPDPAKAAAERAAREAAAKQAELEKALQELAALRRWVEGVEAAKRAEAARVEAARRAEAAQRAAASADPRSIARAMLADRGWSGQFSCLDALWNRESNWNHRASNPSSGAYGIPQALPGSKMASAGADWQTNPATQIRWGLGYIGERYGTPCGAWAHSQRTGWY